MSDHLGITVAVSAAPAPKPPDRREIVLRASSAIKLVGNWQVEADPSAAGGRRLRNPDAGAAKLTAPLALPANYLDIPFEAEAGRPYRIWLRARADRDRYTNDSAFIQFGGTVTAGGAPVYRTGTTSAITVILENCSGCEISGWGWQDNGYGSGALGRLLTFKTTGRQTLRIQQREDGLAIDQIVISSQRYLNVAPGLVRRDATVLR